MSMRTDLLQDEERSGRFHQPTCMLRAWRASGGTQIAAFSRPPGVIVILGLGAHGDTRRPLGPPLPGPALPGLTWRLGFLSTPRRSITITATTSPIRTTTSITAAIRLPLSRIITNPPRRWPTQARERK